MTKTRVAVAAPRGTAQSWPKMIEPSLVRRCVVIFGLWQSSRLFYAAAGFCDSLIVIDFFPTHSRYSPLQVALLLLRWGLRAASSLRRSLRRSAARSVRRSGLGLGLNFECRNNNASAGTAGFYPVDPRRRANKT